MDQRSKADDDMIDEIDALLNSPNWGGSRSTPATDLQTPVKRQRSTPGKENKERAKKTKSARLPQQRTASRSISKSIEKTRRRLSTAGEKALRIASPVPIPRGEGPGSTVISPELEVTRSNTRRDATDASKKLTNKIKSLEREVILAQQAKDEVATKLVVER